VSLHPENRPDSFCYSSVRGKLPAARWAHASVGLSFAARAAHASACPSERHRVGARRPRRDQESAGRRKFCSTPSNCSTRSTHRADRRSNGGRPSTTEACAQRSSGQRAYKVDGKALRLRKTLIFEDPDGRQLAKIQERVARIKDSMEIEDADGNRLAMVKKALISPLRDRWTVSIGDGPDLEIQGKVLDHEYTFSDGRTPVATVSKQWFRVADTCGVEIAPDQDPVVVLAATVAVDMMVHEGR
jgi:uncharacterized protein YxjI